MACFHLAFGSAVLGFLIAGYLFCLFHLSRLRTSRRAFYFGLAIGLAGYAPQLGFFWTIFGGGAVALWLVLAFWLGLFVVLARQCRQRFGEVGAALLTPFLWTGLEYFRSELYYLRFSWLSAGYAFSGHFGCLGQFGVYGAGFCLMWVVAILSLLSRKAAILLGGAFVLVLAAVSGAPRVRPHAPTQPSRELAVAGVQMEFPAPAEVPLVLDEVIRRHPRADLLVLSEYTFDGPVPGPVKRWCRKHQRYLIVGGKDETGPADFYDTAFVIGPTGEVVFRQAKCVPIQFFKDGLAARAQSLWDSPWGKIGICVCYDLSYRRVTDRLIRMGAQALVVPTMDLVDWGGHQHRLHARTAPIRAAEYGVPIFRVASSGISQLVDGDGTVVAAAAFGGERVMLGGVLNLPTRGILPFDHFLAPFCVWVTGALIVGLGLTALGRRAGRDEVAQPPAPGPTGPLPANSTGAGDRTRTTDAARASLPAGSPGGARDVSAGGGTPPLPAAGTAALPGGGHMKTFFRLLLRLLFRFRAYNLSVLATPGPVLLIPNHVSWIDWLFLWVHLGDDWKFVVSSVAAQYSWIHRLLLLNRYTFPIDPASPYAVKRMAEFLQRGGRLVLFAEGQLSRTGTLMKIYDGTGFLLFKTQATVITCYLRGANRLRWSRQPGWRRWFPRVSAHFSEATDPPRPANVRSRQARARLTQWLWDRLVGQQFQVETEFGPAHTLEAIAATARRQPRKIAVEDFTMQHLTYRRLLIGTDLLARELGPWLAPGGERVGVLLPNINATPVTILSLWTLGKVPAVLNFSLGTALMLDCARLAGLKQVVTSRGFAERARIDLEPFGRAGLKLIYLEDLRAGISAAEKIIGWFRQICRPRSALRLRPWNPVAVILFTSGSEGLPKGVELTHANLLANIRQMLAVTDIEDRDRLFNALPLFHSFGLTVGTILGLVRGLYVFLYPSPLHYRLVPTLCYDRNCTIFLSTNTFLNGYARKAHPYDFHTLRYLFAAGEKLQASTVQTWSERFGVRILEGYGATECSPCVSVNTPLMPRHGTVGRLMPGMTCRLEPVEGVTDGGRLLVRGPNVMRGYLNRDANAGFQALGGWYDTGDIVSVDEDGCLRILGRLKRFAKVSGEMVSLTAVEDALAGAFPEFGLRCQVAVVARPDADKGEGLIAITNEPRLELAAIRAVIHAKGLPNLCAPREIRVVREIPKLGTGKVNHRELAKLIEAPC